jgi:hypothetical protein
MSEATIQRMGGAVNHILDNSVTQLGDVVQSIRTEVNFQSYRGNNWVLMAGQSILGSDLELDGGPSVLPDATTNSAFFRQGASLGTFQADTTASHNHGQRIEDFNGGGVSAPLVIGTAGGGGVFGGIDKASSESVNKTQIFTDSVGSAETRPVNYQMNFFIKINNDPT